MSPITSITSSRTNQQAVARAREARRTVGRERHYQCSECGFDRCSWVDLRSCPSCGSGLSQTVVKAVFG